MILQRDIEEGSSSLDSSSGVRVGIFSSSYLVVVAVISGFSSGLDAGLGSVFVYGFVTSFCLI